MSRPVNNMSIYDFYNPNQAFKKFLHESGFDKLDLRYIKDFLNTKVSMFDYKNLPNGYTAQIIESFLLFNSRLCWYQSPLESIGLVLCRYVPDAVLDFKMKPEKVSLIGLNGIHIADGVPYSDIILALDNTLDIPPFLVLFEYISKMKNVESTLEMNLEWLKLPALFSVTDKSAAQTIKQLFKKAFNYEPFAVVDASVATTFKQWDLKLPVELADYIELFKNYKNWAVESFGIYGGSTQKKERLLVGEVQSQGAFTDTTYADMRKCRQLFIDELNSKFGYKIELVECYAELLKEKMETQSQVNMSGGGQYGFGNENI